MGIKKISAEEVNRTQVKGSMRNTKWNISFSIKSAKERAGRKQIYRLPNGVYVWRK